MLVRCNVCDHNHQVLFMGDLIRCYVCHGTGKVTIHQTKKQYLYNDGLKFYQYEREIDEQVNHIRNEVEKFYD